MLDKYPLVIKEMREVVRRWFWYIGDTSFNSFPAGFTTMVDGTKWGMEYGFCYGRMVLAILENTQSSRPQGGTEQALGLDPTTRDPREINDEDPNKGIEAATKVLKENGLEVTDENIFIAASLKEKGIAFLKGDFTIGVRKKSSELVEKSLSTAPAGKTSSYNVRVGQKSFAVSFENGKAVVNGQSYDYQVEAGSNGSSEVKAPTLNQKSTEVKAQMPGKIFRYWLMLVIASQSQQPS